MKKVIIVLTGIVAMASCTSNEAATAEERKTEYAEFIDEPTSIEFEQPIYDFGTVTDGEEVEYEYEFTNTGDVNLVLLDVSASCGCTVPENWPKEPIAPGETGKISVKFNSTGRVGAAQKSIRVDANTNPTTTNLTLKGTVVAAE